MTLSGSISVHFSISSVSAWIIGYGHWRWFALPRPPYTFDFGVVTCVPPARSWRFSTRLAYLEDGRLGPFRLGAIWGSVIQRTWIVSGATGAGSLTKMVVSEGEEGRCDNLSFSAAIISGSCHPPPSPSRQREGYSKSLSPRGRGWGEGDFRAVSLILN